MNLDFFTQLLENNSILALIATIVALLASLYIIPEVIKRMKQSKHFAVDINKKNKPKIPEMGGVGLVLAVTISMTLVGGLLVFANVLEDATGIYAALAVVFIASYIGLFDDIAVISRKNKAIGLLLAGLPLAVARPGFALVEIPFYDSIQLYPYYPIYLLFWLLVVPFGVLAAANAFNMSAGYNGVEPGQTSVIAFFLMLISIIHNSDILGTMIFAATFGASLGLYSFNRFPARTFVGDIGTLSMGALIATGAIYTGLEIYAVILIIPMFYEGIATFYYSRKKIERRDACMNPVINKDGTLQPPEGAERYTLFYFILSKKPMTEGRLVQAVLAIYIILGLLTLTVSILTVVL